MFGMHWAKTMVLGERKNWPNSSLMLDTCIVNNSAMDYYVGSSKTKHVTVST